MDKQKKKIKLKIRSRKKPIISADKSQVDTDSSGSTDSQSSLNRKKSGEKFKIKRRRRLKIKQKSSNVHNASAESASRDSDGSQGYGNISTTTVHTNRDAPVKWRGKFGYYFRLYPEELINQIQMDEVASFSVTEAGFAQQISDLLKTLPNLSDNLRIVDATAGVGGNSMSFLCNFKNIISVELDLNTSRMLQNNLSAAKRVLDCRGNFMVIKGNFMDIKNTTDIFSEKADIIFFDPPWGGREYLKKKKLRLQLSSRYMSDICNEIHTLTRYIALKLPVNYDIDEFSKQINRFGGNIISIHSISNRRGIEKMKLIIVNYSNVTADSENVEKKIREDAPSVRNFSLSSYPFYYENRETCLSNSRKFPVITDPEDFYNLIPLNLSLNKPIELDTSKKPNELNLEIYQNLDRQSIINTFNYLFHNIRIGIFVMIKDNKLKYFIPFQNMNFRNNWKDKITFRDQINALDEYVHNKSQFLNKRDDDFEMDIDKWSANNCLIGNWTGNEIGDMGWYELREILHLTCENKTLNDSAFFFNRRDHPVITTNRTEPYFHIFNNLTTPLRDHSYENYVPILSYSKNDNFADILFPTYADWRNITGKIYPSSCTDMEEGEINLDWNRKKPQAVFRGSATGCGTTPEDNQRIKLSQLAKSWYDKGINNLLDAGLVGKNLRDKKFMGKPLSFFRYKDYSLQFKARMPMNLQSNFKYIVHVDGHVSAYRLGKELSLGSCILKVESLYNYKLWFSDLMIPNAHYLPIKKNLDNLGSGIIWCQRNDAKCKKIAENARELYSRIMTKEYIIAYAENIINSISHNFVI